MTSLEKKGSKVASPWNSVMTTPGAPDTCFTTTPIKSSRSSLVETTPLQVHGGVWGATMPRPPPALSLKLYGAVSLPSYSLVLLVPGSWRLDPDFPQSQVGESPGGACSGSLLSPPALVTLSMEDFHLQNPTPKRGVWLVGCHKHMSRMKPLQLEQEGGPRQKQMGGFCFLGCI